MSHDRGCPCGREPYEYQDCSDASCTKKPKPHFDTLVFVGRFQPFHNGHKAVVDQALRQASKVIIVVGSSFKARDIRDPFTYEERVAMISACYPSEVASGRLLFTPVRDYPYDDSKWVAAVQRAVEALVNDDQAKIGLIGHSKDHTSFYLKIFPMWGNVEVANVGGINATDIRRGLFDPEDTISILPMKKYMPQEVADFIGKWMFTGKKKCRNLEGGKQQWHDEEAEAFSTLFNEYQMIKAYKEAWEAAPYPPTFVTVDAVVVQSGHVLLVKRKAAPGMGLWALPGGFLNQNETLLDGAIRELREETKIKVPVPVLRGSVVGQRTFDAPNRSLRGRTITTAFHIDLGYDTALPKVKGADDAEKARWVPFSQIRSDQMFEDHYSILDHFLGVS